VNDAIHGQVRRCAACGEPTLVLLASVDQWDAYRCRTCDTRLEVPRGGRVASEIAVATVVVSVGVAWTLWTARDVRTVMAVDHDIVAHDGAGHPHDHTAGVGSDLFLGAALIVGAVLRAGWTVWAAVRLRLNPIV